MSGEVRRLVDQFDSMDVPEQFALGDDPLWGYVDLDSDVVLVAIHSLDWPNDKSGL